MKNKQDQNNKNTSERRDETRYDIDRKADIIETKYVSFLKRDFYEKK